MFSYVYVLQNIKKQDFIYVEYSQDLKNRFQQHNRGQSKSTKPFAPFKLIHYEAYTHSKDAKRREKYFKTTKGRAVLKNMLKEYFKKPTTELKMK